jgi:hypothetical protein
MGGREALLLIVLLIVAQLPIFMDNARPKVRTPAAQNLI